MKLDSRFLKVHGIPLLLFLCCLAYVVYRAVVLSLTHDEALTYTIVRGEIMWRYTANNHWLNTWMIKAFWPIFGVKEWVLRLPNILALFVYAWAAKRLFYTEGKPLLVYYLFFAALLFNQFVLDFFGLARGYGLAQGLITLALSYFLPWVLDKKRSDLIKFLLAVLLSFYANFAFFIPIALLGGLAFILAWDKKEVLKKNLGNYLIPFALAAILMLPGLKALIGLSEGGQLYIGQDNSLFESTFFSYLMMTVPLFTKFLEPEWFYTLNLFFIATGLVLGFSNRRLLISAALPIGIGMVILLFHWVLKMNYPVERTIIYLLPFFLLVYYHIFTTKTSRAWLQWPNRILIFALLVFQFVNFKVEANLDHSISWKGDAEVKVILNDLKEFKQDEVPIHLGIPWYLEPSFNFYRKQYRLEWLNDLNRDGIYLKEYNFYLLEQNQRSTLDSLNLDSLRYYPVSGLSLYRKK